MVILIGRNILDMELGLIGMRFFISWNWIRLKCIIFGVDMNSSAKVDNRKKDILILSKGPTQGLEHTLSAEKIYSINFTEHNKKFCLSLHYNGRNS